MMHRYDRDMMMKLINELIFTYHFDELFQGDEDKDPWNWFHKNKLEQAFGFCYESGATKGVLIIYDCDYVIKFNLPGETRDYCGREYNNYLAAKEAGLAKYFAAVELLAEVRGITFYAQQKIECDEDADSDIYNSLRERYESDGEDPDPDDLWDEVDDMGDWERVELLFGNIELCRFINDRRINDLHNGNIGLLDGCRIIHDFSGFGAWAMGE